MAAQSTSKLPNKNLDSMPCDYLYHININIANTKDPQEVISKFGDVKVVCMGGTKSRMETLAKTINKMVYDDTEKVSEDLAAAGHRYALFKVGQVLCVSHGVGSSTMSVVLHEMIKLVFYARCKDPIFIRVGTSGGLGVPPGTVVVTKNAYNGLLRNEYEIAILGERVIRPAVFDEGVVKDLIACKEACDDFDVIEGNTMGTDCFYEGQGRIDGASCHYTDADKMAFLKKCQTLGIKNIEMEAAMFSSLTKHVGIKAADVCVTLVNRINGDQVTLKPGDYEKFQDRPLVIVGRFVKRALKK